MRIDERDVMFSRMSYKSGTKQYDDYYDKNPNKKEFDDELRAKPSLCSQDTPTYDEMLCAGVDANFMFLSDIKHLCDGKPHGEKKEVDSVEIANYIKKLAKHYGALDVGTSIVDDEFFYSKRGRHPEVYGQNVDESLKTAIVYSVKMEQDLINTAPNASSCLEASKAYVDAAMIGMQISYMIRNLGYNARCHMDGNYLLRATPLAEKAGIGQVGRNGVLITKSNGCFARLGVVTTDMNIVLDNKRDYGIVEFCKLCKMCVKTCPGKTITDSDDEKDWYIDQQKCYSVWRNVGTDCGVCLSSCPIGQEIDVIDIEKLSVDEKKEFIAKYKKDNGPRKYFKSDYFK